MADTWIDVQLVAEVALPYEAGAEQWLDETLAPYWQNVATLFPGLALDPQLPDELIATVADMMDSVRMMGEEPPDIFRWFVIPCADTIVGQLLPLIEALPFISWAGVRPDVAPTGVVSYGTNIETRQAFHLGPAPWGIDALYAWQVAGGSGRGVRVADLEHAWDLTHEDFVTASITPFSVFGTDDTDHGTGALGILMSGDNGVGTVGVSPEVEGFLVTARRQNGIFWIPAAVVAAGDAARPGGVVLIEVGHRFFPTGDTAHIPLEFHPLTQAAIRLLTLFGITVVEGAGNGNINLDGFPFLAHLQPDSPLFVDSRAIIVGAGVPTGATGDPEWERADFSTYGKRVDCFAWGESVVAPSSKPPGSYTHDFNGTSAASAIIAGMVCAIQGMSLAATDQPLLPTDIRRLLRDPELGTPIAPGKLSAIGAMPDFRKIARHQGWTRIVPVAAVSPTAKTITLVHIDDDDHLVRREWSSAGEWSDPLPVPAPFDTFKLAAGQPTVAFAVETTPRPYSVIDVIAADQGARIKLAWWDTLGFSGSGVGDPPNATSVAYAEGRDLAAIRPTQETIAIVGANARGRLMVRTGDAATHLLAGLSPPLVIDTVHTYKMTAGPVMVSQTAGKMDVIAVDDGGDLVWLAGTILATVGTGWQPPVSERLSQTLHPMGPRPAVVATPNGLVALLYGADGFIYSCAIKATAPFFGPLEPVDANIAIAMGGPVSLVLMEGNWLMAAAVDRGGLVRTAFRSLSAGSTWSALIPVDRDVVVSPLGGVTGVALSPAAAVFAVLFDGRPCWSQMVSGIGWLPMRAV